MPGCIYKNLKLQIVDQPIVVLHGHEAIKEMSLSEDCLGRPTGPFYEMRTWNKRLGQFF